MEIIHIKAIFGISLFFVSGILFTRVNGTCPDYEHMKNFDMSRFEGLWFVIQRSDYNPYYPTKGDFSAPGPCYAYYYRSDDEVNSMNILNNCDKATYGEEHTVIKYDGLYMTFTNADVPTDRILKFNGSIIDGSRVHEVKGEHVIVYTDYYNSAVVMTCITYDNNDVPLVTAAILQRISTPNWPVIESLREDLLKSYTIISGEHLETVVHSFCPIPVYHYQWPNFSTWTKDRREEQYIQGALYARTWSHG